MSKDLKMIEDILPNVANKIEVLDNGCWGWKNRINKHGYAELTFGFRPADSHIVWNDIEHKTVTVHRLVYYLFNGIWSTRALPVDHLCHTKDKNCVGSFYCPHRSCVNPDHLEQVTAKVNSMRGRRGTFRSANREKTHCKQGHEYTLSNTARYGNQGRKCLTCKKQVDKEYARKNREKIAQYKVNYYKQHRAVAESSKKW